MTSRHVYDWVAVGIQIASSDKLFLFFIYPCLVSRSRCMKYHGQFLLVPTTLLRLALLLQKEV